MNSLIIAMLPLSWSVMIVLVFGLTMGWVFFMNFQIFNGTMKKIANPFSAEGIAKLPFIKVVEIWRDPQHVISFAAASNMYQPSRLHLVPSGNVKVLSPDKIRDVTAPNNLYFDVA
jgi:hypothetical protein